MGEPAVVAIFFLFVIVACPSKPMHNRDGGVEANGHEEMRSGLSGPNRIEESQVFSTDSELVAERRTIKLAVASVEDCKILSYHVFRRLGAE